MPAGKVTDETFDTEVLGATGPVVVDFWAEWCGPCRALSPIVDEVAETVETVKILKLNIEESPKSPTRYGVRGIPTLMVFRDGQVVDTRVGGMSKAQLTDWLESLG